jgi:two-component system chemotaxis sensor kinase CheA
LARNEELVITPPVIDVILAGADYLKTDIGRVECELNGAAVSPSADYHELLQRIRTQMTSAKPAQVNAAATKSQLETPRSQTELRTTERNGTPPSGAVRPAARPASSPEVLPAEPAKATANAATVANPDARVVKVDIGKLDFLMDIVGELVIAQSMVTHDRSVDAAANPKLLRNLAQLTRITGEVQKTAMAMRMVPVGQLFKRSVRLVRDLMRKSGKDAELVLAGEETEVDRNIVEELADPLMHMVRNAADHAIEPPEERLRAGKNPKGKIHLKAYHQAGSIMIEVADDGRGLDREKILKKARERGLITDGSQLPDRDVFNLIFEPGFSTAEKLTDISGRGVGMDVVRKQIQRMRGRVDIESKLGQGTTFHLKLPLTLAIIDGLVVGVGGERYIAPIYSVREIFRPTAESIFTVEDQAEMVLVRGGLLPVVRLYQRFGVTPKSEDITQSLVVVAESETRCYCVVVDELIDTQEVVIKNLGETFRNVGGIAGGTILGDGRVGLILDIDGLFTGKADA